jgi:hypothetical protein
MAVVIWTPIVMILCAFIVNTGFLISDRERAADLAEQSARRVADDIDQGFAHLNPGELRVMTDAQLANKTSPPTADGTCLVDAQDYFRANGITDVTVTGCTIAQDPIVAAPANGPKPPRAAITVTIRMTHKALFSGFSLGDPDNVVATGTARPLSVS